jgi:hypothetical protein
MRTIALAADRVGKELSEGAINQISRRWIEGVETHPCEGRYRQSRVDLGSAQIWNEYDEQYGLQLLVQAQLPLGELLKKPSSSPLATRQIRSFWNQVNPFPVVPLERQPINGRLST